MKKELNPDYKKAIALYLPFYLGQECMTEDGRIGRFSGLDLCQKDNSITMITVRFSDDVMDDDYNVFNDNEDLDRIRLILLPLIEMSEDDMGDVWKLIGGTPHLFYKEEFIDWIVNGTTPDGLLFGAYEMALTTKLLISKGFDVFDLIPAGLAIDKRALNQEA